MNLALLSPLLLAHVLLACLVSHFSWQSVSCIDCGDLTGTPLAPLRTPAVFFSLFCQFSQILIAPAQSANVDPRFARTHRYGCCHNVSCCCFLKG